ncbi:MAG: 30S ribosome-binding factor RbfA [Pseudomonadota bacterium]
MPTEFSRAERVGSALQRELSLLVPRLQDERLGLVTIQEARVSRDLSHAKIYFTVMGEEPAEALKLLEHAAGHLRHELGRAIKMRTVPQLHFVYDRSVEEGERLEALIEEAVAGDAQSAEAPDSDPENSD